MKSEFPSGCDMKPFLTSVFFLVTMNFCSVIWAAGGQTTINIVPLPNITPTKVLEMPWGNGNDEVSVNRSSVAGNPIYTGATFLGRDRQGRFYIFDSAGKIIRYNEASQKTNIFGASFLNYSPQRGKYISPDLDKEAGAGYLRQGDQFEIITSNGKHLLRTFPHSLLFTKKGNWVPLEIKNGSLIDRTSRKVVSKTGVTGEAGTNESEKRLDIRDVVLSYIPGSPIKLDGLSKLSFDKDEIVLNFSVPNEDVRSLQGFDTQGNLYLLAEVRTIDYPMSDQDYYFIKIGFPDCESEECKLVSSQKAYIDLTNFDFDNGTLFECIGTKDGLQMLKWQLP